MSGHTPGETWRAVGKSVFRGRDCIGIFDTGNSTDEILEERARIAAAAPDLLAAAIRVRARCQAMRLDADASFALDALDHAIAKATTP